MNVEIIYHDVETAKARIKFEHLDVVYEDNFDLALVTPGQKMVFERINQEFTSELQLKVIEQLIVKIQNQIESGMVTNRLEGATPSSVAQ